MANNAGRQAGGGNLGGMNEHVEFTVKAEEDLYLTGSENTILRVAAETNYSCLMLKTQRFSSLFRHYAKYHGLRKDDLEYYFVNPLENEDTPESVQLQRSDTIMVRKRRKPEPLAAATDDDEFFADMKELVDDDEHMDAVFYVYPLNSQNYATKVTTNSSSCEAVDKAALYTPKEKSPNHSSSDKHVQFSGRKREISDTCSVTSTISKNLCELEDADMQQPCKSKYSGEVVRDANMTSPTTATDSDDTSHLKIKFIQIRAHKCILTARSEYFKAFFRKSGFRETSTIKPDQKFDEPIVRSYLEFIYTNRISSISTISTDDLLTLLHLADLWIQRDLKRLVEHELIRNHMDVNTVAKMYCATADYHAKRLQKACIDFMMENIHEVTTNITFQEELKAYPHLCIPVLKAAADLIPEPSHKKQRTNGGSSSMGVSSNDHLTSSNVGGTGSGTVGDSSSGTGPRLDTGADAGGVSVPDTDT